MNTFKHFIKRNSLKIVENMNNQFFNNIQIIIKDPLPKHVNLNNVLQKLAELVPERFFDGIDGLYIGKFGHLEKRNVTAVFDDGVLYVTSEQDNEEDFLDDCVHEICHAIEQNYGDVIYADGKLDHEFIRKRQEVFQKMIEDGFESAKKFTKIFYNSEYNKKLDEFLYKDIGYDNLSVLTKDIFVNCYSMTSLQEYWASGLERFFFGEGEKVGSLCPVLYKKIKQVTVLENE